MNALLGCLRRPLPPPPLNSVTRLVVVGDVHDGRVKQWSDADAAILRALHPDMTLFVGDIGNEAFKTVEAIATMDIPKLVILGNHDAWHTPDPMIRATLDRMQHVDQVNRQLDALGDDHIGFRMRSLPGKPVSIVGARPFTSGGKNRHPAIVRNLYGYEGVDQYAEVIAETALSAPPGNAVVIVAHNGPTGLGDKRYDICGVDFLPEEGDHGDEDLEMALLRLREHDRSPVLVTFGHMHHKIRRFDGRAQECRRRVVYDATRETLFLNCAVVRRLTPVGSRGQSAPAQTHHFCLVEIENGRVQKAEDVYVYSRANVPQDQMDVVPLVERGEVKGREWIRVWNTHLRHWEETSMDAACSEIV